MYYYCIDELIILITMIFFPEKYLMYELSETSRKIVKVENGHYFWSNLIKIYRELLMESQ